MIGVVVRELTYLKVLQPIMEEMAMMGVSYILYHLDAPRGEKEYNRATLNNVKKSSTLIIEKARKVKAFKDDRQLLQQLLHDKIQKLVSIEIYLWTKGYISDLKKAGIKTYSLLYLSDSLWETNPNCITSLDKIYYTTNHLKNTQLDFLKLQEDNNRDIVGSPIFNCLTQKTGDNVLVLLPNLKAEHIPVAFGNEAKFCAIIEKLAKNNKLIFKTRNKQWMPTSIKKFATQIVHDGERMYPPVVANLFEKCHATVMFYSSGIYEAVCAGQYVVNIPISLKRWRWDKAKMGEYFSTKEGNLYNFSGVVESVSQDNILKDDWTLTNKLIEENRQAWIKKFIGIQMSNVNMIKDIIND